MPHWKKASLEEKQPWGHIGREILAIRSAALGKRVGLQDRSLITNGVTKMAREKHKDMVAPGSSGTMTVVL